MGLRGPVPQGRKNVVKFPGNDAGTRPNPPHGMTARARALFKRIVAQYPSGTYGALEITLLRAFCDAEDSHNAASKMLTKEGAIIYVDTRHGEVPRRNPWFDVQRDSSATMKSISAHLRKITGGKTPGPKAPGGRVMFKL